MEKSKWADGNFRQVLKQNENVLNIYAANLRLNYNVFALSLPNDVFISNGRRRSQCCSTNIYVSMVNKIFTASQKLQTKSACKTSEIKSNIASRVFSENNKGQQLFE